jgi:hypothetical protein
MGMAIVPLGDSIMYDEQGYDEQGYDRTGYTKDDYDENDQWVYEQQDRTGFQVYLNLYGVWAFFGPDYTVIGNVVISS